MKRVISRAPCLIRTSCGETSMKGLRWQTVRMHSHDHDHGHGETTETVTINWKNRDGSLTATKAKVGSNLLSVARKYEIELEGACEGVCACSTCHIILEDAVFDAQPEPTDDEEDMLGKR
jgi:ferredoxin